MRLKNVGRAIKRHAHQIAAVVACAGVVATTVESIRAGMKMQSTFTQLEAEKGSPLTVKEKIVAGAEDATPAVVAAAATATAIVTGAVSSEKLITGLSVACATALKSHAEYRQNVQQINPGVDAQAMSIGAKERVQNYIKGHKLDNSEQVLYYDTHTNQTFQGRPNLNLYVEQRLEDIIMRKGYFTENTYRLLMGETIDPIGGDLYGWDQFSFINQKVEYPRLMIYEEICTTDDGCEFHVLSVSNEPDVDFLGQEYTSISSPFDVR